VTPDHPHSDAPLLIAGGGIGGLSAALALARRGVRVRVLEAEPEFSESGAGIQIGPNGSRMLRSWGLGDALEAEGGRPRAIHIHDGLTGAELASIPLGSDAENRYGAPYYVAERRALHHMLLEAVRAEPKAEITPSFRLEEVHISGTTVTARATDRTEVTGRALIGADGVHSRVRGLFFDGKPAFSGRNAWRATAPAEMASHAKDDGDVYLWIAPRAHLVHYACGSGGPLNAVAVVSGEAASPGWGAPGDIRQLIGFFDGWAERPREILRRFSGWMSWPLMTVPALASWTRGNVTLLGDAAHPILPFLASGAVMAVEDAAVMATELGRGEGDISAAFGRYERRRMPRIARVQRASARMGEIYHMGGAMRLARNISLAALPGWHLLSRNDWLYGYKADAQEGG
jgi:salicylate hydroxylase